MPVSEAVLEDWFTYHPPVGEQRALYGAIRAAEEACQQVFAELPQNMRLKSSDCEKVNDACKALAKAINVGVPDCADKSAAFRCIRLARNAANEFIMANVQGTPVRIDLMEEARRQLYLARWQGSGGIACRVEDEERAASQARALAASKKAAGAEKAAAAEKAKEEPPAEPPAAPVTPVE